MYSENHVHFMSLRHEDIFYSYKFVICDLNKFTYQFSSTHTTLLLLENYLLKFITISPKIKRE